MARYWVATLREAVRKTEGGDVNPGEVASNVVPLGLHLNYDLDFRSRRPDDIAPTFTSPLLSSLIGNILQLERPPLPRKPASFHTDDAPIRGL